jgi:hypothetical protein
MPQTWNATASGYWINDNAIDDEGWQAEQPQSKTFGYSHHSCHLILIPTIGRVAQ